MMQFNIEKGSDMVKDFLCSTCEEQELDESADYYCGSCKKCYCCKCIHMHSQLFIKHSPYGRGDMKKWPVAKKVEDFLIKCDVHKEKNLEILCKDHSQLCCNFCVLLNHSKCKTVMLLSDFGNNTSTDLKHVSDTIQTTLAELKELQNNLEASIQGVQSSFDEQLHKIQETREKVIAALNMLEKETLREMKDTLTTIQATLKSDVDKCATLQDELKQLGDAILEISNKSRQELSLIASIKYQDKIQLFKNYWKNFVKVKPSINFQPYSDIVQYLSKFSGLVRIDQGDPDQIIRIDKKSEYDGNMISDDCVIRDFCVLPSGQVLVADMNKVKLLNQQFKLVSHCSLSNAPLSICQITPSEVGVTVGKEVQFIKVNKSQLVIDRKLRLEHSCYGIAHHQGDLFVTSGCALYKYSLSGELVSKLHQCKSGTQVKCTVEKCAVSPTGDKLYITNSSQDKLLTLAMDGSVLATFMDPILKLLCGVHVTPVGQLLVCGRNSNTILQVDSKGNKKLATLATQRDGVNSPCSVSYNNNNGSIIVGQRDKNKILVFKVQ
ncbi:hypothetical protein DPMN_126388 [Dreissena polymorpha]|uniref:B box-type domain-containing protein n=4 Tax=Dreissena polymorpha TaxID=45954 RepID=A0A9D4GVL9_DREPO|nr:hypothetical protein DPMN_126388 [Dreissena polymorpha]